MLNDKERWVKIYHKKVIKQLDDLIGRYSRGREYDIIKRERLDKCINNFSCCFYYNLYIDAKYRDKERYVKKHKRLLKKVLKGLKGAPLTFSVKD